MAFKIETAFTTDPGLNPHKQLNEDSVLILEKDAIFAVADGVGGAHAGDLASQTAVRTITDVAQTQKRGHQFDGARFIKELIEAANDAVLELSENSTRTIASTIAIMAMVGNTAYLGHLGDSRIYVFRDGLLTQLTRDHSQVQELLDRSPGSPLVSEKGDDQFLGRNVITQALGVEQVVRPDIQKVILKKGDLFLLCTDGVYTCISNKELSNIFENNGRSPADVCKIVLKKCHANGANDHLSAIVIRLE
jgi:protein phosphatase